MSSKDVIWIYPVHNRLYYNQITFPAVLAECKRSERFLHLYIIDDMSEDGTTEFLKSFKAKELLGGAATFVRKPIGNSTKQWNMAEELARTIGGKYLFDICNDILFSAGMLDRFAKDMDSHLNHFAIGGIVSGNICGDGFTTDYPYMLKEDNFGDVSHIGCGMIRLEDMRKQGPITPGTLPGEERYFGFTSYQHRMREKGKKIAVANHIRFLSLDEHPAYSRLYEYKDKGYSRNILGKRPSVFNGI